MLNFWKRNNKNSNQVNTLMNLANHLQRTMAESLSKDPLSVTDRDATLPVCLRGVAIALREGRPPNSIQASIYLDGLDGTIFALENKVSPTPTEIVDVLKECRGMFVSLCEGKIFR